MAEKLDGRNRATADEAASFVDEHERLETEIAREKAEFMNRCKKYRDEQKENLDDAKSQGVAKGLVKDLVKTRALEAKVKAIRDGLDDDQAAFFVDIRKALGDFADTGLGAAAVERNEEQDPTTAAIVQAVADDEEHADEQPASGGDDDQDANAPEAA